MLYTPVVDLPHLVGAQPVEQPRQGPLAERVLELQVRHLRRKAEAWAVPEDVVESHAGELERHRAEVKEAAVV